MRAPLNAQTAVFRSIMIAVILTAAPSAWAGVDSGGGGGMRPLQWRKIGETLAGLLPHLKGIKQPKKLAGLARAVASTRIQGTARKLSLDGEPKDARNFPERKLIVFNVDAFDAVPDGSRRAALVYREYLQILGEPDSNYEYSSQLYENAALKGILNNMELMLRSSEGKEIPYPVRCSVYKDGALAYALDPVGQMHFAPIAGSPTKGRPVDSQGNYFVYAEVSESEKGRLAVLVDSNERPPFFPTATPPVKRRVRGPFVTVTIGYGFDGVESFKGEIVATTDMRVTGDHDSSLSVPSAGLQVQCKRVTNEEVQKSRITIW